MKFIKACWVLTAVTLTLCLHSVTHAEEEKAQKIEGTIYVPEVKEIIPEYTEDPQILEVVTERKEYRYIQGCPLSLATQQGIFDICEENNISFEFVMAVIFQESSFRPEALGDNCESKGLMQIQTKWHKELMDELHVTDLHDPLQNVKVGVALLCQYFEENDDVYYVLMKYNGGHAYANKMMKAGKVSDYAREITERAIMYERENGI